MDMGKPDFQWWEKTVEYEFMRQLLTNRSYQLTPLSGKMEQDLGDALAGNSKGKVILIEFKRTKDNIADENKKYFSTAFTEYLSAYFSIDSDEEENGLNNSYSEDRDKLARAAVTSKKTERLESEIEFSRKLIKQNARRTDFYLKKWADLVGFTPGKYHVSDNGHIIVFGSAKRELSPNDATGNPVFQLHYASYGMPRQDKEFKISNLKFVNAGEMLSYLQLLKERSTAKSGSGNWDQNTQLFFLSNNNITPLCINFFIELGITLRTAATKKPNNITSNIAKLKR